MRSGRILAAMCVGALGMVMVVGCPAPIQLPPIEVPLGSSLGEFELQADVPKQLSGTTAINTGGTTVANGTLQLDPSAITITPAESAKVRQAQTAGTNTAVVTVRVASADAVSTVCDEGEQYGPFTIEFDDDYVVQSVTPSQVTLSQNTVDLLNAGQISLCIEAVMSIDGTISIGSLVIQVGITL
jgi:hypothetical protein